LGRSWRRTLARLLDPDEVTERDFWRIVGAVRDLLANGIGLKWAIERASVAVTAELVEWQAEL
jgi:hypothetical protein